MNELTDQEKALLDIFGRPLGSGPRETAIREATGLSVTAGTQIVNRLLDTEAALAYAPTTVNHLRRLREQRQLSRPTRKNGSG